MRAHIARFAVVAGMLASAAFLTGATPRSAATLQRLLPSHAAVASPIPNAFGWQDELVDKLGLVGSESSIALDSNGFAHIAYYDFTQHSLKYAAWDGVAWTIDTVERDLGGIDQFGPSRPLRSAIAVYGSTNYIVYEKRDDPTGQRYLRYALGGPGGWNISTLESTANSLSVYAPSLRLDNNHSLHVSFTRYDRLLQFPPQSIIYARLDVTGTAWVTQTVATLDVALGTGIVTSLALDANNHPQIAYASSGILFPSPLNLASLSAGNWVTQTVTITATSPSLAVDPAGNPDIAYLDPTDFPFVKVKYANWDGTWHFVSLNAHVDSNPSLALDNSNRPHIAVEADGSLVYLQLNGAVWQSETITETTDLPAEPALALDAAGNAHFSYSDRDGYQDLHYISWARNWQTQTVALTGDEAHLAVDLHNRPFVSYSTNPPPDFYHVSLANWTSGGAWQYREALPFTAADHSLRLVYDVNHQALPILAYADLENVTQPHLGFAQWNGATFVTQTVDGASDVGFSSSLSFDNQANPIIAYQDINGAHPHIKLAVSSNNAQTWAIYTDTAAPSLGVNSGLRALSTSGSLACCRIYIAYYESASQALRLATWNSGQWTDELIDGGPGNIAGLFVSLAVDRTTGKPAMAYLNATHGELHYAFWRGSAWLTETVDSGLQSISDLSLSLALYSDQYPRIAYTARVDKSLRLAWSTVPTSTWTIEKVATFNTDPAGYPSVRVSSQAQERDHIAFSQPAAGVVYAFHSATLPYSLYFNPLQPCVDAAPPDFATLGGTLAQVRALSPADLSQVDDLTTLRALRDLFALSPAGQYYIDLYYQYAPETGRLALGNPSLLWDAYRTLQNFVPGFQALVAGRGNQIVITQAMVDQVNGNADRLVAAGSSALGAAINTERAKHNHLQAFVGQTFQAAANVLGVPVNAIYLPLVRR